MSNVEIMCVGWDVTGQYLQVVVAIDRQSQGKTAICIEMLLHMKTTAVFLVPPSSLFS